MTNRVLELYFSKEEYMRDTPSVRFKNYIDCKIDTSNNFCIHQKSDEERCLTVIPSNNIFCFVVTEK